MIGEKAALPKEMGNPAMPSPFPGMDPSLENPATWPNLHLNLIAGIQRRLTRDLRPRYFARAEERVYISDEDDPGRPVIVPDVRIIAKQDDSAAIWNRPEGSVATIEPVVMTTLIEDEIHEPRVEVIDAKTKSVVTVIEVLSPTNKIAGSRGQESFRKKRSEVMGSSSHWVEIDLLRSGLRLVAGEMLPRGDYFVHVSRVDRRPKGLVWPIRLHQPLPVVDIPLLPGDDDYRLDLQQILNAAYDDSGYDLETDYTVDPPPPLTAEQAEWIDRHLRSQGLRK